MVADIGTTLFVDFLGMTQYPGAPFTGNIYRDLIMFFLVPTIFIIMILYIMSGRIIPNRNFRVMLGVGAYLFIIAGRYYAFFAILSGPYFIFLIFILGVAGYLGRHFRPHGGGYPEGGGYSGGDYGKDHKGTFGEAHDPHDKTDRVGMFDTKERGRVKDTIHTLQQKIVHEEKNKMNLEKRREQAIERGPVGERSAATLETLINQSSDKITNMENQIYELEKRLRRYEHHSF